MQRNRREGPKSRAKISKILSIVDVFPCHHDQSDNIRILYAYFSQMFFILQTSSVSEFILMECPIYGWRSRSTLFLHSITMYWCIYDQWDLDVQ